MNYADDYRSPPRPFFSPLGRIYGATVLADPLQTGHTGIALSDCLSRNQPNYAIPTKQAVGSSKEIGDEIRHAPTFWDAEQEKVEIRGPGDYRNAATMQERRISDKRIKPRVLPLEYLRELN